MRDERLAAVQSEQEILGPTLDVGDIWLSSLETALPSSSHGPPAYQPLPLEEVEKQHILRTLTHTDWNKSQAAAILNIANVAATNS